MLKIPKVERKGLEKRLAKAGSGLFTVTFATYGLYDFLVSEVNRPNPGITYYILTALVMALMLYVMFEG